MKIKEYGSDFHYIDSEKWRAVNTINSFFAENDLNLYYSGRAALYAILETGIKNNGWHTLAIPSYYCHEVINFIKPLSITIEYYEITPFKEIEFNIENWEDSAQTAVLIVDYFGVDKIDYSQLKNSIIIEDFTHNIEFFKKSKADYCFGSLRKALPIPVGGFCYFGNSKPVAIAPSNLQADSETMARFSAMYLKNQFLKGTFANKDFFRKLYASTEENFTHNFAYSSLPNSAKDYLNSLLVQEIFDAKKKNLSLAKSLLQQNDSFELMSSKDNTDFALTLKFNDSEIRDSFKSYLINHNIFPIVLWPNQFIAANKQFEQTILFIHVDFRYNKEDITTIINIINHYFDKV
ncbi:hypothetical protein [Aequorivita sp. Q41]|uniref:hypothetical protein n=1 Tax=Aequorivita sp. Q41 TaxID=3153300 RepID=UPI0032423F45